MNKIVVFTDRDGDQLSVTPRNTVGNTRPDPIISVTHDPSKHCVTYRSVVLTEEEFGQVIINMVIGLSLNKDQIRKIIVCLGEVVANNTSAKENNDKRKN